MRIRALSIFEQVIYHCCVVDPTDPQRPTLEVEALLRDGDADSGPLLLSIADYIAMVGGLEAARPCLDRFRADGRIVDHLGVAHLAFPLVDPGGRSGLITTNVTAPIAGGASQSRSALLRLPDRSPSRSRVT